MVTDNMTSVIDHLRQVSRSQDAWSLGFNTEVTTVVQVTIMLQGRVVAGNTIVAL